MPIKGLIFDFDGLILDTETAELLSWKELFNSQHLEFPFKQWCLCVGTSNDAFDIYSYFGNRVNKGINLDELFHGREKRMQTLIHNMPALPGVHDLLIDARTNGIRIAIASSSPRPWVTAHLDRLGIRTYFDSIHTCEEVEEVKPHPDLYFHAIDALKLQPEEAAALEDSPNGIKAAKGAGLFCFAIPNSVTVHLDTSQADITLPDLKNLTILKMSMLMDNKAGSMGIAVVGSRYGE